MLVSVTRFRLRSLRFLPLVMWRNILTRNQVVGSEDCVQFKLRIQRNGLKLVFWTLTLWPNQQTMLAFRNHGDHLKAMPQLRDWSDEASYTHWETENNVLPEWPYAQEQLKSTGKLSMLNFPSKAHSAGQAIPV